MSEAKCVLSLYITNTLRQALEVEAARLGLGLQAHCARKLGEDPSKQVRRNGGDKVRQFIIFVQDFLARAAKDPAIWSDVDPKEMDKFRLFVNRLGNLRLYDPRAPKPWKLEGTKYADLQPPEAPAPVQTPKKRAKLAPASP